MFLLEIATGCLILGIALLVFVINTDWNNKKVCKKHYEGEEKYDIQ